MQEQTYVFWTWRSSPKANSVPLSGWWTGNTSTSAAPLWTGGLCLRWLKIQQTSRMKAIRLVSFNPVTDVWQLKELGIIIYECRCLAVDLHRIFNLYWQLEYKEFVPPIWSRRLSALYSKEENFSFHRNGTQAKASFSVRAKKQCLWPAKILSIIFNVYFQLNS